ncbi:hypothetical protein CerSpe_202800 [Prunus speciosa]
MSAAAEATHYRHSVSGGSDLSASDDSDDQSWHSMLESTAGGGPQSQLSGVSVSGNVQRDSCDSNCSLEVDLESGVLELKVVHLSKVERNCRICHLGLEGGGPDGIPIDLGCSCKGDLGAAHKQCAETWFKIKGDTTCEICGSTAFNIATEQTNEANGTTTTLPSVPAAPMILVETRTMWHGRRIMNFLLACMIFAFGPMAAAPNNAPTAVDKEQIFGMAEKEMEYRVELFNKLTHTCFNKCVEKKYKEAELNMGENSCIDRCVSKYWHVTNLVGQLLGAGRPPM